MKKKEKLWFKSSYKLENNENSENFKINILI